MDSNISSFFLPTTLRDELFIAAKINQSISSCVKPIPACSNNVFKLLIWLIIFDPILPPIKPISSL